MDGRMDGQIQVWCGRRRCRNRWEWWQSRLKKWQLPCKSAWLLLVCVCVWLCLTLMLAHAACSSGSRVLVYPFPHWDATFAVAKTRFCGGSCKAVGTTPVTFPFGMWSWPA